MPLLSVVAVRVIGVPSKAVPVSVMVTPLMPVSLPFTAASLAKSRNTVPAMDEALTTTGPELVLLSVICSIDEVLIVALLVKVWPLDDRVTTRTGTVISPTPPELKVPRSQVKDVPPAAPVQVVPVVVPAVTANVGVPVSVGSLTVTPLMLNHPVVNFGYRVDGDGKSMFFTGDHEPWANIYSPDDEGYAEFEQMVQAQCDQLDQSLQNLDVLIADSSYTKAEYPAKVGWGHGTMEGHLAWVRRVGAKTLVCTHHEPTRSDDALEKVFGEAVANCGYVPGENGAPNAILAREGLELIP